MYNNELKTFIYLLGCGGSSPEHIPKAHRQMGAQRSAGRAPQGQEIQIRIARRQNTQPTAKGNQPQPPNTTNPTLIIPIILGIASL